MFQIRKIDIHEDHPTLCKWWEANKWPSVPKDMLPLNGYIVEYDAQGVCAGFIYQSDSRFGWIEWIVANPEVRHAKRSDGMDLLVDHLIKVGTEQLGMKALLSSMKHPTLMARFEKLGFKKTDEAMTNLIYVVKEK